MLQVKPLRIDNEIFLATEVQLPKTTLLMIQSDTGYVMCGALDINLLRDKLSSRGIIAARAVGVRTLEDLMAATVDSCTQAAEAIGIHPDLPIAAALLQMRRAERSEP